MTTRIAIVAAGLLLVAAACQSEQPPSNPQPSNPPPSVEASQPAEPAAAIDLRPRRTRGGQLRIANESIHGNPAAAVALLERFDVEPDAEIRAAIAEALPRTAGDWAQPAIERLASEPDATVRKALVASMARADAQLGARGVTAGLADRDKEVRFEAAATAASLPVAALRDAGAVAKLSAMLGDAEPPLRATAARSLGVLGVAEAFDKIEPLLEDVDAAVRLQALRALSRIDGAAAAKLPSLRALRSDGDSKVSRAAQKVVGPE